MHDIHVHVCICMWMHVRITCCCYLQNSTCQVSVKKGYEVRKFVNADRVVLMSPLFVSCTCREWREELSRVMASTGKMWVTEKRFLSFAPSRERSVVQW